MNGCTLDELTVQNLIRLVGRRHRLAGKHAVEKVCGREERIRCRTAVLLREMIQAGFDPSRDWCLIGETLRPMFEDHRAFRFRPNVRGIHFFSHRLLEQQAA